MRNLMNKLKKKFFFGDTFHDLLIFACSIALFSAYYFFWIIERELRDKVMRCMK